jgi:hypothetical protein
VILNNGSAFLYLGVIKHNPSGKDAAMSYSTYLSVCLATALFTPSQADANDPTDPCPKADDVLDPIVDQILEVVERFRQGSVSPVVVAQFEKDLQQVTRELARVVTQWAYNHLEPIAVNACPVEVRFEGDSYRRLGKKTPQQLSTLFGTITLRRLGYRAASGVGAPVLFPLCQVLGVVHGATPALAERVAFYQAEAGATQKRTLERLRREHGVCMGVKRLRQVTEYVATAMEEHRLKAQANQVIAWLEQAQASRGRHRPVLAVGRDGITLGLPIKGGSIFEVATTATISVYDRRGRRLGTVYLALTPEPGQASMSGQVTQLLREVLRQWSGPLPRLSYVTDAGDNETKYYQKVLRRLRHPVTGQRLEWTWVVDYYHASERLWKMADALFGTSPRVWSWVRKMQKLLLKPAGIGRVLHSAAALRSRLKLCGQRLIDFERAYRYLQTRKKHMHYADYRRLGLPIGSGVTEAACKTVYTQRLKLSGMRWKAAGAQTILTLRVILLSGVWSQVYERTLANNSEIQVGVPDHLSHPTAKKVA